MRRFKNILFLFEDDVAADAAFGRAVELAERNGAELTLTLCVEAVPVDDLAGEPQAAGTWTTVQSDWKSELEGLADTVRERGIEVSTELLSGIPFREVIAAVIRRGHDLVVKAARGPGGTRELLFGSTDLHLMRKCPCPVWIHRDRAMEAAYGRIMAAIDVGDDTTVSRDMTRFILDLATSLGELDGSDVHVVHAWSSIGERMAASARRGLLPSAAIAKGVAEEETRRQQLFQAAVTPYLERDLKLHLHLVHGDPREVLALFARDRDVDLIVMGTLARTGIPGFFMGNTAEDVLRQVESSVLTLKPQGFVSPVQ